MGQRVALVVRTQALVPAELGSNPTSGALGGTSGVVLFYMPTSIL